MIGLVRLATVKRMRGRAGPAIQVAAATFALDLLQLVLYARGLVQHGAEYIADEEDDDGCAREDEDQRWLLS